ncbi:MAG: sporulation transcriptional regulator SpoIIID [Clostridia bacterium]|nr:sporulation transcriptional regulator SpoIIID [Clostridia bacterium]
MYQRERERCEIFAEYLVENNATVRSAARHFEVSKSTVHKDITMHLPWVNPALYRLAKKVLEINKSERHLRGGEATRKKYMGHKKAM